MAQGTHKIPQNVTQYQGRIIGKFTAKQFIFLAVGAMLAFLIFNTPLPNTIKIISMVVIAGVSLLFTLLNVQGRTTDEWISHFLKVVNFPTQRVWRKAEHPPSFLLPTYKATQARISQKEQAQYELEKFIELWNPSNPSNEYSKEELIILNRVKEHGGLATNGAKTAPDQQSS